MQLFNQHQPQTNKSQSLLLGMTTKPAANWQNLLAPAVATRSTKPESQAKEIARKEEERSAEAGSQPITATIDEAVLVDQDYNLICRVDGTQQYAAYKLLDAIATNLVPYSGQLWGYGIKQNMAILTADLFRETPTVPIIHIYPWIFYEMFTAPPYLDPYEMIVPSTQRNDVGYKEFHRLMDCECVTVRTVSDDGAMAIGTTRDMVTPWHQISYLWEVLQHMQVL